MLLNAFENTFRHPATYRVTNHQEQSLVTAAATYCTEWSQILHFILVHSPAIDKIPDKRGEDVNDPAMPSREHVTNGNKQTTKKSKKKKIMTRYVERNVNGIAVQGRKTRWL